MKTFGNEYVYPNEKTTSPYSSTPDSMITGGMTKREYFAAMAMQGVEASNPIEDPLTIKDVAKRSVKLADALIKALNEESQDA